MGALQGWHVGIEQGFPLGIYWGHWAEDHVSQEGGLGQGEWQEHAQPGEMGPGGEEGSGPCGGLCPQVGCAVPTVAMSLSCPTSSHLQPGLICNGGLCRTRCWT